MIITRSPLRISLGGGGTDLPSYYEKYGCNLTTMAINKYVYICISDILKKNTIIKYSKTENIFKINDIKHPIIRETIKYLNFDHSYKEIITLADIPSGTGLGSSGAFNVALMSAIKQKMNIKNTKFRNAEDSCHIEINVLNEPSGKQDQFISSYGGIQNLTISKNGKTKMKELNLSKSFEKKLINNSLLIFTGYTRKSSKILKEQKQKTILNNYDMTKNLHEIKKFGFEIKKCLIDEDIDKLGNLMDKHWKIKQNRSKKMSNNTIDRFYNYSKENGAIGGKLIGAGGGGFIYLICKDKTKIIEKLKDTKFQLIDYKIDHHGTRVILDDEK